MKKLGKQDQILVINPELIDEKYHFKIKKHTNKYISYLYDSVARCNILHLLDGVFDEIFSFDKNDIQQYGFQPTQNYNYIDKNDIEPKTIKQEIIYIASIDERLQKMYEIANYLIQEKITFRFIIVGKKAWKFQFKKVFFSFLRPKHPISNAQIHFSSKRIEQHQMLGWYQESNCLLDIVRENQTGLSFRIFEAMAFEKKIISSNLSLKEYDFFNNNNYFIFDDNFQGIKNFVLQPYQKINMKIYDQYTLESWVKNVFKI